MRKMPRCVSQFLIRHLAQVTLRFVLRKNVLQLRLEEWSVGVFTKDGLRSLTLLTQSCQIVSGCF